jgi:hypothetical protein
MGMHDWQDRHGAVARRAGTPDRAWLGAVVAAVPHVLILAAMTIGVLGAEGTDRGYAALYGFAELWVLPVAAVAWAVLSLTPRGRPWRLPIVLTTAAGFVVVLIATLIVGNGATWS